MSLLRSHSSKAGKAEADDEQTTGELTSTADDSVPAADSPAAGGARYAFAGPDDGTFTAQDDSAFAGPGGGTVAGPEDGARAGALPGAAGEMTPEAVPAFTPAPPSVPTTVPLPRATTEAEGARAMPATPMAGADLDAPLLSDAAERHARWQRAQAGFVDNPREAVGEAADLLDQTAQALIDALRQRQRRLGEMWERRPADGPREGMSDTEHLRLMMQRYRTLFHQLSRP